MQDDILRTIDDEKCMFLVLLDLSAVVDIVSHDILLKRLESHFGFREDALKWITSYSSRPSQAVLVGGRLSSPAGLKYGVPQGSVLGPVLFIDYISPVASVAKDHDIPIYCYADHAQLYKSFTAVAVLDSFESCVDDVRCWMNNYKLKLNDSKTEFIVFASHPI